MTKNNNKRRGANALLVAFLLIAGGLCVVVLRPDSDSAQLERITQTEKCSYRDYWIRHYDECFPEGFGIFDRPEASDLDDGAFPFDESAVLYASAN